MATIEERAHHAEKKWLISDDVTRYGYEQGYIHGATEQKQIDIEKLKDIMNRLMLDTRDKAEIIKAMEE